MTTETTPSQGPRASSGQDKLDRGVLLVAGVVVLGAIMSILDITVVSVAQPTFQTDFDASPAAAAWTMTGYTLALATVIPLSGWAADRFGTALAEAFADMSHAFASSFVVAVVLVAFCLVPVWFLPRKAQARQVDPAALVH